MTTCFLVLGTPRSGTSCVAGVLHHLGIVMGRELESEDGNPRFDWPDISDWNPVGFFQDAELENLQDAVFGGEFPKYAVGLTPENEQRLCEIVANRESLGCDWGAKTSRMPYLLPNFVRMCSSEVRLIIMSRAQSESIESWATRAECGADEAAKIITRSAAALTFARRLRLPIHDITFDDLLANPAQQIEQLAAFCRRPVTQAAIDHVRPNLRRFKQCT